MSKNTYEDPKGTPGYEFNQWLDNFITKTVPSQEARITKFLWTFGLMEAISIATLYSLIQPK